MRGKVFPLSIQKSPHPYPRQRGCPSWLLGQGGGRLWGKGEEKSPENLFPLT